MSLRLPSLTWRLFVGIGAPVTVIILLIALLGFRGATSEINEVYDSQLAISAQSLLRAAQSQGATAGLPAASVLPSPPPAADGGEEDGIDEYARWHSFRAWRNGHIVLASPNAPKDDQRPAGYVSVTDGGETWRVYTLDQGGYVIETRENTDARGEEIAKILSSLVIPLVGLLPVIAFVLWFGIRMGLRGLRGFASAVSERSPDDLSRIEAAVPAELAPVAEAVNELLAKLDTSLDQERAFTDNASHELRTPLAVIKAQADVIAGARNAEERAEAVDELALGVVRATRVLEQLLTLARLRHAPPQRAEIGLMAQAGEAIKDAYPAAAAKGIELRLGGDAHAAAQADPALLHLILRNILENAVKYAPGQTAVDIDVTPGAVVVRDRGPGIPEAERDKVFARFYRIQGTREPGSGLGLSIVRAAAQQLGCNVRLVTPDDGTGLVVRISFPG